MPSARRRPAGAAVEPRGRFWRRRAESRGRPARAISARGHVPVWGRSSMPRWSTARFAADVRLRPWRAAWRDQRGKNLLDGGRLSMQPTGAPTAGTSPSSRSSRSSAPLARGSTCAGVAARDDPAAGPAKEALRTGSPHTRSECRELLEGTDACFAPVLSLREAAAHPHLVARGVFAALDGVPCPAPAPRFFAHAERVAPGAGRRARRRGDRPRVGSAGCQGRCPGRLVIALNSAIWRRPGNGLPYGM